MEVKNLVVKIITEIGENIDNTLIKLCNIYKYKLNVAYGGIKSKLEKILK